MTTIPRRTVLKTAAAALGIFSLARMGDPAAALADQKASLQFELYEDSRGGFRWRLKAANGRVLATSGDSYKAKADCRNAIDLIKRGAATAAIEELP